MSTYKLRRSLEELERRRGYGDCAGCGYPTYKNADPRIVLKGVPPKPGRPPAPEVEYCAVCGREKRTIVIRMPSLQHKSRGDGIAHADGVRDE
jgi:hypothetical protein